MLTAVTEVAAVWRFEQRWLADGLFDNEEHTHERHHEERRSSDAHHDDGRDQAQRCQGSAKPWESDSPHGFTGVCCVWVHDVQHYLRMPGLCCTVSDGPM